MTRKDYVAIANAIKSQRNDDDKTVTNTLDALALSIADYMENDNEMFDHAKFIKACR